MLLLLLLCLVWCHTILFDSIHRPLSPDSIWIRTNKKTEKRQIYLLTLWECVRSVIIMDSNWIFEIEWNDLVSIFFLNDFSLMKHSSVCFLHQTLFMNFNEAFFLLFSSRLYWMVRSAIYIFPFGNLDQQIFEEKIYRFYSLSLSRKPLETISFTNRHNAIWIFRHTLPSSTL